jgi:hypothetical protein
MALPIRMMIIDYLQIMMMKYLMFGNQGSYIVFNVHLLLPTMQTYYSIHMTWKRMIVN